MRIYRPCLLSSLEAAPWKNGGGSTRTLAMVPADATLDSFLWRISLAQIDEPGSFSLFSGIDRTILLWSGNGVALRARGWSHTLDGTSGPFAFRGEDEIMCELIDGPSSDLNVMARRDLMNANVNLFNRSITVPHGPDTTIIICASSAISVCLDERNEYVLTAGQFLRVDECVSPIAILPVAIDASFVVITLKRAALDRTTA